MNKKKSITKNTIYLYIRMMVTMVVTLYTSRVVLEALGVTDFGIYQTVGGIVGLLSFLNSALSTGSSRFLTFELGKGVTKKLHSTFSTLLLIHVVLAIIIVIISESFGIWYIKSKLVVPTEKINEVLIVFHLSVLTSVFSITQVPYTSIIIAHEDLSVYAYVSIVDAILKLIVAFLIKRTEGNALSKYALFLCIVQIAIILFYRFYCKRKYEESNFSKNKFDISLVKEIGSFSSWSLFASVSTALTSQGILVLLNNYFSPIIVSARVFSNQVNNAANQFVQNFRVASNPQIVKKYSNNDYIGSKKLLLNTTFLSYYLFLLIGLPVFNLAEPLLKFWLGTVPEYSVVFLRWGIIQSLFSVFDTSFYTALYAKGQLKENALISPMISFLQFPLGYILFKKGYSPLVICYLGTSVFFILGCIVKPILLKRIANYKYVEMYNVIARCLVVSFISMPASIYFTRNINKYSIIGFILTSFICIACIVVSIYIIGMHKELKKEIFRKIKAYLTTLNKGNKK